MKSEVNLKSMRARKARLAHHIGPVRLLLEMTWIILSAVAVYCVTIGELPRLGYAVGAGAVLILMLMLWYRYELRALPIKTPAQTLDDVMDAALLARLKAPLTSKSLWKIAMGTPEGRFVTNRLLLTSDIVAGGLSDNQQDASFIWQQVQLLLHPERTPILHGGVLATSLIILSPTARAELTHYKLEPKDVVEVLYWLERQLAYMRMARPKFGGIGRDWATGFTPTLEHFGQNISGMIEARGGFAQYYVHSDLLDGMVNSLERGNGVALIGEDGVGKTTLVHGLAQRLLEGQNSHLQYYQVVSLNASLILSYSDSQLEKLMLTLFGEAVAAGNIILFLDDAELFFTTGVGSFDMSQILMPVLKNRNVKIIAAFTPTAWQHLQATRQALTNSFASVAVTEPDQNSSIKVIEDTTLILEHQNNVLISYEAIREAYRLSGQYMQEQAYPGKAIHLLEQAMPYATQQLIAAETVQMAVEKMKGVKVSAAQAPEADMLLNLEDRIHDRMINQRRAVNVIAAALRRGRAGVSSPNRPVGSFLFLGPTGVGKTELARSLAAIYFGDERQMVRLDMSEYQRPEDVSRLLATGGQNERSLLLAIREQPFSVVLLDEIEKAHPNILNLLLQMLDEGQLTDEHGRPASFRSSIIIATSNAGAADIAERVKTGSTLDDFERPLIDKLIREGQFKPELINRFDEVVLFRPLNQEELGQVAQIMLQGVNKTLANQRIKVQLTPEALQQIVRQGYDPEFGARPMRRIIQKTVENAIAVKILRGEAQPGSNILLDVADLTTDSTVDPAPQQSSEQPAPPPPTV